MTNSHCSPLTLHVRRALRASVGTRLLGALALALAAAPAVQAQWQPLGGFIAGEADDDRAGESLSLDGDRVAVGASYNDAGGGDAGHVRVFEYVAGAWVQLGPAILGEEAGDRAGTSVSLDGDRVAVCGFGVVGGVHVFEYDATANGGAGAWAKLGGDFFGGTPPGGGTPFSVSLDGDRVAVGVPANSTAGSVSGQVLVFEYDAAADGGAGAWTQLGGGINGEAPGDDSGGSVSLDGDRVAIGARRNDGGGDEAGHVRVYEWDGTAWAQLGQDLDGEAEGDRAGDAVSLDGDRVAVGAPLNDEAGDAAGQVRVFAYDAGAWVQLGSAILGEGVNDRAGHSVSLDGDRVAVGSPGHWAGGRSGAGQVRVFEYSGGAGAGTWVQFGGDIDGESGRLFVGQSVSLDGDRVAVSATGYESSTGQARVYEFDDTSTPSERAPVALGLSISAPFPNPARTATSLVLSVDDPSPVTVSLHDALGRRLALLYDGPATPGGAVRLRVEVSALDPGVYLVHARTPGGSVTRALIASR